MTTRVHGTIPRSRPSDVGTGFGAGKVILLGEHAVVQGQTALATGISRGIRATVSAGTGFFEAPAWGLAGSLDPSSSIGRAVHTICRRLAAPPVDVRLDADIPPGAGLGSSAAMAVAVSRAVAAVTGADATAVAEAVDQAERIHHGTPSGVDAAAASTGALGLYRRGAGWIPVHAQTPLRLCIGLSGRPHRTAEQVARFSRWTAEVAVSADVVALLGRMSEDGAAALVRGELRRMGRLMDLAHGLLAGAGLSSPELDSLVHLARHTGALGAKLSGAGGGGAVVAIVDGGPDAVLSAWAGAGYTGFATEVGRA